MCVRGGGPSEKVGQQGQTPPRMSWPALDRYKNEEKGIIGMEEDESGDRSGDDAG